MATDISAGTETNYFELSIVQNKIKQNQMTALHLMVGFLLLTMGFVAWLIPDTIKDDSFNIIDIAGLSCMAFGIVILIIAIFFNKKILRTRHNLTLRILEIIALLVIFAYCLIHAWYLPAAYSGAALIGIAFAYIWERNATRNTRIIVSEKGICLPKLTGKQIAWPEVERFIIKHGIVTIDCRDNHLYQFNIININNTKTIVSFAENQIQAHKHLYRSDW